MSFVEVTNVPYKKATLVPEIALYRKHSRKVLTDSSLGANDIRAPKNIVKN